MRPPLLALVLSCLAFAVSCDRDTSDVRAYTERRTRVPILPGPDRAGVDEIRFDTPSAWVRAEASGTRLATFRTPAGFEATLARLPGDGGGFEANLSRWLSQMGAEPSKIELQQFVESLPNDHTRAYWPLLLLDLSPFATGSAPPQLVAWVRGPDFILTLKVAAPPAALQALRLDFEGLARSLRPAN
jgi:hypothetical protein